MFHMPSAQPLTPEIDRNFRQRFLLWAERGLPTRAATVLADAGCDTYDDVQRLGREYFEVFTGCGKKTFQDLAIFFGWPPKVGSAVAAIAAALALSLSDPEQARDAAEDVVISGLPSFLVTSQIGHGQLRLADPASLLAALIDNLCLHQLCLAQRHHVCLFVSAGPS